MKTHDIFISYRRDGGFETAKHLFDLLIKDGYSVSFDLDTLREGSFDKALLKRIEECEDFILIVDPHCFERTLNSEFNPQMDWLRQELSYALFLEKNVIPLLLSGATFPENLPEDIKQVLYKNGPAYSREYFDSFYHKLKSFLHSNPTRYIMELSENCTSKGAEIHIDTDSDCVVYRYNKKLLDAQKDEDNIIHLQTGRHIITIASKLFPIIEEKYILEIPNEDFSDVVSVCLRSKEFVALAREAGFPVSKGQIVGGFLVEELLIEDFYKRVFLLSRGSQRFKLIQYDSPSEGGKDFKAFVDNQKQISSLLRKLKYNADREISSFIADGHYCVVMDYVEGQFLSDWCETTESFPHRLRVSILLCHVLKAIHETGVVCHDLTPVHNIQVSKSEEVYITGLEWAIPNGTCIRKMGTPWYYSVDERITAKSDIFSLGIILCELVTGGHPFKNANGGTFDYEKWPKWIREGSFDEPADMNPDDITPELNQLLVRSWAYDPSARPTLPELIDCLEGIQQSVV